MKCLFYFHINTQLYLRDTQKNYVLLSQPGEDPGFCIRGPKFVEGSGVLKLTSSQNYRSLYGRNFESFLAYLSRRQTACIPEKKMGLSIFSVELKTKISYSTEYILSCVDGGDLRNFSVEDALFTREENWGEHRTQLVAAGPGQKTITIRNKDNNILKEYPLII